MTTRRLVRGLGSGLACAAVLAAGCTPRPCDSAINPSGARYQVDVDGIYPIASVYSTGEGWTVSTGTPSCNGTDGLASGTVIQLRTVGQMATNNGACENAKAVVLSGPSALTLEGVAASPPSFVSTVNPEVVMYSATNVGFGDCSGVTLLMFFAGPGNLFASPQDGGGKEPAVMYRLFDPSSGSCSRCEDNFVVQLFDGTEDDGSTNN
jgi:hypothetical protein